MSKLTGTEVTSYAGAAASIGASLTLTEIGVIVGIVTALLTFGLNAYYMQRRDQREQGLNRLEQELRDAQLARLRGSNE